jgi:hypothetical protein
MDMPILNKPESSCTHKRPLSHQEVARRLSDLALHLASHPEEAKAFRESTGVYDKNGELTERYR